MKLLGREGVDRRTVGIFYVEVVQEVLLFGSETWVMTPVWRRPLRVSTNGRYGVWRAWPPKRQRIGTWVYPPIGAVLETVGMDDIGKYIA